VIRIGIVKPSVTLADKDSSQNASDVADALAGVFAEKLTGANLEVVRLANESEARGAECDFVVRATLGQKHAGGGMLGMMLSPPKLGKPPDMTQQPSPAASELMAALASSVKYKDEFTYNFQLAGLDGASAVQKSGKLKVDYPGADYLSPVIGDATAAIKTKIGR